MLTGGTGMLGRALHELLPEATFLASSDVDLRDARQFTWPECVATIAADEISADPVVGRQSVAVRVNLAGDDNPGTSPARIQVVLQASIKQRRYAKECQNRASQ